MSEKYGTTSGNELESELKQVIVTASRSEFHFMSKIISENSNIWVKVFKNGQSKICGKEPLKNLKRYGLLGTSNYLKAAFRKFYSVHS